MSPTVFRDGPFRFFVFSREVERIHIHVTCPAGEAKFWLEPEIELARSHGLAESDARARIWNVKRPPSPALGTLRDEVEV